MPSLLYKELIRLPINELFVMDLSISIGQGTASRLKMKFARTALLLVKLNKERV